MCTDIVIQGLDLSYKSIIEKCVGCLLYANFKKDFLV